MVYSWLDTPTITPQKYLIPLPLHSQFSTGLLYTVEGNILSSRFLQICFWCGSSAHWKNGLKGHFTTLSLCVEENGGNISSTVTIKQPGIRKFTSHWTLSGRDFLTPKQDLIH